MGLRRRDEITWNQFSALMNELVKGMLAVGTRLAPDDGPCLIIHRIAFAIHILAITFHIALLEVRRKPMQVLVVGEDSMCFGVEEIIVPLTKQRHDDWNVLLKRCLPEMGVARFCSLLQLLEVFVADAEYDGKPDGAPNRIPAPYPIPNLKHVLRIDADLAYRFGIGREGHEM